jgi:hypothetical protein
LCGKVFETEADLVEHEVTVHPNVRGEQNRHSKREKAA